MAKTSELAKVSDQVELVSPQQIMNFATDLKKMVVDNKLYTPIQGKNYINVEGWQIAGAFIGTFPVVEKVENLSTDKEFKYRAEVSLRDKDGNIVGGGMAVCSNKEPGKTRFAEFAVMSMAQTRAVGKAFRLKIGWLMKIAGYETTPSEEMDVINGEAVESDSDRHDRRVRDAVEALMNTQSMDELRHEWTSLGRDMLNEPDVEAAKNEMKKQFGGGNESA